MVQPIIKSLNELEASVARRLYDNEPDNPDDIKGIVYDYVRGFLGCCSPAEKAIIAEHIGAAPDSDLVYAIADYFLDRLND